MSYSPSRANDIKRLILSKDDKGGEKTEENQISNKTLHADIQQDASSLMKLNC